MPVAVQRKEQDAALALFAQVRQAMESGEPRLLELSCEKEEEKRIILDGQHEKGGWLKKDDKLIHPFVKEKIKRLMEKRD